jgi:hypothetical protein
MCGVGPFSKQEDEHVKKIESLNWTIEQESEKDEAREVYRNRSPILYKEFGCHPGSSEEPLEEVVVI